MGGGGPTRPYVGADMGGVARFAANGYIYKEGKRIYKEGKRIYKERNV